MTKFGDLKKKKKNCNRLIFVSFLSQVRNANVDDDDIVKRNPRAAERPKQKRQEKNEGNNIVTNFTFL